MCIYKLTGRISPTEESVCLTYVTSLVLESAQRTCRRGCTEDLVVYFSIPTKAFMLQRVERTSLQYKWPRGKHLHLS